MVDVREAETNNPNSVLANVYAGCSPTRVLLTQRSSIVWVSVRDENNLRAYNARDLRDNPSNALLSITPVGVAPDGAQPFDHRRFIAVANSNRFYTAQVGTVSILDYAKALKAAGGAATVGTFSAGAFPRQWDLSPNGKYLYLTEFSSDMLAIFPVSALIKAVQCGRRRGTCCETDPADSPPDALRTHREV